MLGGERASLPHVLLWVAAVGVYGAFWFALAIAVNALGKSAATNAVILAACWLALVVVVPSVVNLAATTLYPMPSRVEFVTAMRGETQTAELKGSQLLGKYFEDHPELAKPADTTSPFSKIGGDDFAMLRLAKDETVGRALRPLLGRFDAQLAAQRRFTDWLGFLSPAILMQSALYDVSGTGVARYQHFLRRVGDFHGRWQGYFSPRVFEKRALTGDDLASLPQFRYMEEPLGAVARRVLWPSLFLLALTILLGWAGLSAYRRFPVVG